MEFRVRFYETVDGDKPLVDFLQSLRATSPVLRQLVVMGLKKLERREHHRPPLTDRVQGTDGLYELRVGRADIARVFFYFRPGQEIICTNGYVKKAQQLDPREVRRAERLRADWEARHP
jgi:phage-related protein